MVVFLDAAWNWQTQSVPQQIVSQGCQDVQSYCDVIRVNMDAVSNLVDLLRHKFELFSVVEFRDRVVCIGEPQFLYQPYSLRIHVEANEGFNYQGV